MTDMVENERLARFMGETSAKLDALQSMVEREFGHVKERLDKGDARFRHMEETQEAQKEQLTEQSKQLGHIFTGLKVSRVLGAIVLSVLAWLGFDHIPKSK